MSDQVTTCQLCGRAAEDDSPAGSSGEIGWSMEIVDGRTRWVCELCTRENVRSIEAKLEPEWW